MRIATLAAVMLILAARHADACSCAAGRSACSDLGRVDALFSGTVTEIAPVTDSPGLRAVRFRLEKRGKGTNGKEAIVLSAPQNGINCGYTFQVGQSYVVYAYSGEGGRLTTNMCAGTKL